jgi:mannose-1-phosphate guanylyltransferase/mannose-1-phosphate guanylyltransferase/mannose-6-phosphate isomerase
MIIPVILAGGSGTRLWPLSRSLHPKQFLPLSSEHTMLQATMLRLTELEEALAPIIVCNEEHRFMSAEQMRAVDIKPLRIVLEPVGKNTAPATAAASLIAAEMKDDPILLVMPADHHIENAELFLDAVRKAAEAAETGKLITFGVTPERPETGFGYIKRGAAVGNDIYQIDSFVEKPDAETAMQYVESGEYYWNSGMFLFRASAFWAELERFSPDMTAAVKKAVASAAKDMDFMRLDKDAFSACPSDSIDYAVMERTSKGQVVPVSVGWNDVGSWEALWRIGEKSENENVTLGDVLVEDVERSYLSSQSRLLTAVGLRDIIAVETKDAVMICPRDRVQDVKKLVEKLKAKSREEAVIHKRVYRPWGFYETVDMEDRFQVKRISVKPGAKLSLQKHFHRAEHWVVVKGSALVVRGEEEILLKEDESIYIPLGEKHRLENPGKIPLDIIEVQSGSYLGEDDIVRFEDVYGRRET